jgi:protein phosphatase
MSSSHQNPIELPDAGLTAVRDPDPPVHFEFGAASHAGLRRPNNEDHYAIVRRTRSRKILLTNVDTSGIALRDDDTYVLVVADGIGGSASGELASELILRIGWELASAEPSWVMKFQAGIWSELREHVADFARRMQERLRVYAEEDPKLAGMGTTWTCAYLMGQDVLLAHAGDSRAYRFRERALLQLTRDHTYARVLRERGATPEETASFDHVLTNAFGTRDEEDVHVDVSHLSLQNGDRLLLCSDGLTKMVADPEIAETLAMPLAPQAACDRLIEQALEQGGKDNVTVIVADVQIAKK